MMKIGIVTETNNLTIDIWDENTYSIKSICPKNIGKGDYGFGQLVLYNDSLGSVEPNININETYFLELMLIYKRYNALLNNPNVGKDFFVDVKNTSDLNELKLLLKDRTNKLSLKDRNKLFMLINCIEQEVRYRFGFLFPDESNAKSR